MSSTYNGNLEEAVLAKAIQNGEQFAMLDGLVEPLSFVWPPYRIMWQALELLYDTGVDINAFTLTTHLDRVGRLSTVTQTDGGLLRGEELVTHFGNLDDSEFNSTGIESLGFQIQQTSALRDIVALSDTAKNKALSGNPPEEILGFIDIETGKISASAGVKSSAIENSPTVAKDVFEEFKRAASGENRYIETGLKGWDDHVGGLYPGRVYIIAGTSGDGKSTLAHNIMYWKSILDTIPCGIITLEMSNKEVGMRFVQMSSGIDTISVEKGTISDTKSFKEGLERIKNGNILYDDSPSLSLAQLRSKMRKMVGAGVKFIIIDQLDLVHIGDGKNENYADADRKIYRIKEYAREFDIPIIVPHQLNKSTNDIKRKDPFNVTLADLKESGEKGADAVVFIRHDDNKQGLIWTKARQGTKGVSLVQFDMVHTMFKNAPKHSLRPIELDYLDEEEEE